ncbi:MAG: MFS transporter [Propionibacteriaceae bacterium]|nr:MFS transporter [Propionibacteriaceae bacterium]
MVRQIWIGGFIAGVGTYSLAAISGFPHLQLPTLLWLITLALQVCGRKRFLSLAPLVGESSPTADKATNRSIMLAVGALIVSVSLLRGADSLRGTFLPLILHSVGIADSLIGGLFIVTAVCELLILRTLGRLGNRFGLTVSLVITAIVGAISMFLTSLTTSYLLLILAQVLYAIYTTGFQLFGLQALSVRSQVAEVGAGIYQGSMNVGVLIGVLLPLTIPGYSPAIFLLGSALCVAGIVFLAVDFARSPHADHSTPSSQTNKLPT